MATLEFVLPEGSNDPCPNACGGLTEDPYGGPCKACWNAVDDEGGGCSLGGPRAVSTCLCTNRFGCKSPDPDDDMQECSRCDDRVYTVSFDGLCDGCIEEDYQRLSVTAPNLPAVGRG